MSDKEWEFSREALLSGLEPSPELGKSFEQQVEDLLRHRLSGWERAGRVAAAIVFAVTAGVFAWASCLFAGAGEDLPPTARTCGSVSFAAGCLLFVVGIVFIVRELRCGRIAPRVIQKASVFLPFALVLVYSTMTLVHFRELFSSVESKITAGVGMLFFWIMATTNTVFYSMRWHREDILLEEKRTQLEIALLREELAKKA
jgi:hypothetical protein